MHRKKEQIPDSFNQDLVRVRPWIDARVVLQRRSGCRSQLVGHPARRHLHGLGGQGAREQELSGQALWCDG